MVEFETWRGSAAEPTFTAWLRETTEPVWTRVVEHRFTDALIRGDIPVEVMTRYLVQDYRFLDRLVALLGAAIACADGYEARIPLCRFAAAVTGVENTYFQRAFDALGVSVADRVAPREAEVTRARRAGRRGDREPRLSLLPVRAVRGRVELSQLGRAGGRARHSAEFHPCGVDHASRQSGVSRVRGLAALGARPDRSRARPG